jgi:hypothetical protein
MQFLTPLPAIIAAALGVPTLLIFYLLKLRRRPVRVSSTMFWVSHTRDLQVNVPFKWIRVSLMLLLQLLILGLLLLALARPAVEGGLGATSRTVILIDRSASMSCADESDGRTRLDEAKARALSIVDEASRTPGGARVGLIAYSARAEIISPLTSEWRALRRDIGAIDATDQPGDLARALELTSALISRAVGDESADTEVATIIIVSDGAVPAGEALTAPGATVGFERVGPPLAEGAAVGGTDNLGIVAASARRDAEQPGLVRLFTRVVNASDAAIEAALSVTLNGVPIQRRPISVDDAGESLSLDLDVPGAALIGLSIERADVMPADNDVWMAMAAPGTPSIAHVVPGNEEDVPADWILQGLLSEVAGPAYRKMNIAEYRAMAASGAVPNTSLIVFDRVTPQEMPPVSTITFGAPPPIDGLRPTGEAPAPTRVLAWRRGDPILRDVSLDSLYVAQAQEASLDADKAGLRSLADGRLGPLMVQADAGAARHVWIGFEPAQSNWPAEAGFVVFMANAIDVLSMQAESAVGRSFTTGEPVRIMAPAGADRIEIDGPIRTSVGADALANEVSLGLLPLAGVYRIVGESGPGSLIPVNILDLDESMAKTFKSIEVGGQRVGENGPAEGSVREIWHWLVMAAAGLLVIEWFWVAQLNRV